MARTIPTAKATTMPRDTWESMPVIKRVDFIEEFDVGIIEVRRDPTTGLTYQRVTSLFAPTRTNAEEHVAVIEKSDDAPLTTPPGSTTWWLLAATLIMVIGVGILY